jgi:alcohol dehydrogenase (cytochrome c)
MQVVLISLLIFSMSPPFALSADVTSVRISHSESEPENWLTHFGNYEAWAYSSLGQIKRENVKDLAPVWSFATGHKGLNSTPLVADGIMYLAAPENQIFALEAATGEMLWTYVRDVPQGRTARPTAGLAVGFGLVFFGTVDNHMVAVDAESGQEVWDVQIEDPSQCGCGPSFAPLLVKDKIVVGVRGEVAHRSYINAFDAKTGAFAWRFWAIPGPGEAGHDTWPEDLWKLGGASTWYAGSYDPKLNLIYWGIGNPAPMLGGTQSGDKLYTNSLVALDADTGDIKWHYQETPSDIFDLDSATEPVLVDAEYEGVMRKLVLHPTKGGFTYILDRVTGEFLKAYPHSQSITWTSGLDERGQPKDRQGMSSEEETLVCPSVSGSRGAQHSAFSPRTGWWYTTSLESCAMVRRIDPGAPKEGQFYNAASIAVVHSPEAVPHIAAFDAVSGDRKWVFETDLVNGSSLLATGGDLIFGGDLLGRAWALDAESGEKIWSFNMGSGVTNAPISYSVKGRQYVAIGAGTLSASAGLSTRLWPEMAERMPPVGSSIFVFALPDQNP